MEPISFLLNREFSNTGNLKQRTTNKDFLLNRVYLNDRKANQDQVPHTDICHTLHCTADNISIL